MTEPTNQNSKQRDVERPYIVDGIKEFDNPMPQWWLILFIFTIVFAIGYMFYLHIFNGPSLADELAADRQEFADLQDQLKTDQAAVTDTDTDPANQSGDHGATPAQNALSEGKKHYDTNCSPCHGAEGQGVVGPNLTDAYWLHGGSRDEIILSITNGIPEKGMIAWKNILGPSKINQITTYIQSLQGSNPAMAKAPEGKLHD